MVYGHHSIPRKVLLPIHTVMLLRSILKLPVVHGHNASPPFKLPLLARRATSPRSILKLPVARGRISSSCKSLLSAPKMDDTRQCSILRLPVPGRSKRGPHPRWRDGQEGGRVCRWGEGQKPTTSCVRFGD